MTNEKIVWCSPYCFIANRKLERYGLFMAAAPKWRALRPLLGGVAYFSNLAVTENLLHFVFKTAIHFAFGSGLKLF